MNMYVSNLSYNTGEAELNELFSSFGAVNSVKIITDRETGRSRGFGFVEMPDDSAASTAMAALNQKVIEGRPLSVSEARQKSNDSRGYESRGRSGNNRW